LTPTHVPTEEKDEVAKEVFYSPVKNVGDAVPSYYMKTILEIQSRNWKRVLFLSGMWRVQHSQLNK